MAYLQVADTKWLTCIADKNGLPLPSKKFLAKTLEQDVQDLAHEATILLGGQDLAHEPKILANFVQGPCKIFCLGQDIEPFAGFWLLTDWFSSACNHAPDARAHTPIHTYTHTHLHSQTHRYKRLTRCGCKI